VRSYNGKLNVFFAECRKMDRINLYRGTPLKHNLFTFWERAV